MAEERDVQDFRFQQLCRFRVFESPSSLPVSSQQLVAASSKYGLVFVGVGKGLKVIETAQFSLIDDKHASDRTTVIVDNFPVKAVFELPAPTSYIALSCDDLTLAVAVCEGDIAYALMYDVRGFAVQGKNQEPFTRVRLGGGTGVKPLELAWNPCQANTLVACLSDGSVALYEVTDKLKIFSLPSSTGAKCVCWSPKGKQCVIGKADGTLVQYDPELKKKREWTCPSCLTDGQYTVVGVTWVSTYVFIAAYIASDADRSVQPTVILITGSKDGAPIYFNMEDICYGNGEDRDKRYFFQYIQKWEMVLATSNNACETAIVGKHFDNKGTVWERWSLNDCDRAELPLTEEYNDTFPVGVTVDFSSQYAIPYGENQKHPPAPILLLLSTDGVIVPYYMIYTHAEAISLTSPPQPLTSEGARTNKFSSSSGTITTDSVPVEPFSSAPPGSSVGGSKVGTSFQFMPQSPSTAPPGGQKSGPSLQFLPTAAVSSASSNVSAVGANTGPSFQFVSKPTTGNLTGPSFSFVSSSSATTTSKSLFGSGPGLFSSPGTSAPPATIAGFGLTSTTPQVSTKSSIFTAPTAASTTVASTSATPTPSFGLPKPTFLSGATTQATPAPAGSPGPASIFSSVSKPSTGFSFTPTTSKPATGFSFTPGTSSSSGFSFGSPAPTSTTSAESSGISSGSAFSFATSASNASVKTSVPQPTVGFAKTEQSTPKPDTTKPSAFVEFGTAPSLTPGGAFLQKLLTSETPGGSPLASVSSGFVQPSKPSSTMEKQISSTPKPQVSTEMTQPQPLSFNFATAKSGAATQPPATPTQPPPGSTNIPVSLGQQAARAKTTVGPATSVPARSSSVPGDVPPAVSGPGITSPTMAPSSTDPLDNTFTKSILEEMAHFEQELSSFKNRAGQNQVSVGNRDELLKIKKQTEEMDTFCKEIRTTTKDQNKEVEEQKSLCLDLHSMVEDCRVREQRNFDPKYEHLLRSRALDPASQEKLRSLQQQYQILDQGLRDVDAILDQEWDDYQNERKNRSRIKIPSTDQVYRAIKGNRNVIVSQKNRLDDLESQLKQLRVFNRTSVWQQPQSETSTDIRDSELSTLADSLLENSTHPLSSTRISAPTSPQKEAKLRDYLSRREVPKIKSTRPENLSMSKIVSAEKLKLALRQKEAESDRSTPEEVKSSTATKRTIASRSGARFPSQSDTKPAGQPTTNKPPQLIATNKPPAQFTTNRQGMMPPVVNSANQMGKFAGVRMQKPAGQNFNSSGQSNVPLSTTNAGARTMGNFQVEDITPPSSTGYDEDDEDDDDDDVEGFGPGYNMQSTASATSSQDNTDSETDVIGGYGNIPAGQLQSGSQVNRSLFKSGMKGPPPPVFNVKPTFEMSIPATKPSALTPGITSGISVTSAESIKIDASSTKGGSGFNFAATGPSSSGFTFGDSSNKEAGTPGFKFGAATSSGGTKSSTASAAGFTFGNTSTSAKTEVSLASGVTANTVVKGNVGTASDIKYYGQSPFGQPGTLPSNSLLARALSAADDDDLEEESTQLTPKLETTVSPAKPSTIAQSTTAKSTATSAANTGLFGKTTVAASSTEDSTVEVSSTSIPKPDSLSSAANTEGFTGLFGKSSGGLFGQQSKSATSIFGQANTTASIFGQGTATASTAGASIFGKTVTSTTAGGIFGQAVSGSTTEPSAAAAAASTGSVSSTEVSSTSGGLFGKSASSSLSDQTLTSATTNGENKTILAQETGEGATTVAADSTAGKSLFGQPTSTTALENSASGLFGKGTGLGLFGQTSESAGNSDSSSKSLFGLSTTTSGTTSLFGGSAGTSASVFGGTVSSSTSTGATLFGGTTSTAATTAASFGGTATAVTATGAPLFSGTSSATTTAASLFGGIATTTTTVASSFGGTSTTATSTTGTLFGGTSSATTTGSTLFGGTSGAATSTATPLFSGTSSTTSTPAPLFGGTAVTTTAATQPSLFGSGTTAPSGFSFGQSSSGSGVFGQTQSPGFGTPAFGQTSSPFGQTASSQASNEGGAGSFGSIFSGLGGKPSEEKANTNVFGSTQFGSGGASGGLFGSQGSKTFGSPSGPFSSAGGSFSSGGAGSVAGTGFGVQQQPSSGFGGSPSFGSGPTFGGSPAFGSKPAFGSSPTFGGGTAFGGGATFGGSPVGGSTFGSPQQPSNTSAGFAGFAAASSPTFGSLAQSTDAPTFGGMAQGQIGFGGSPGFGGGTPAFAGNASNSFGSSPAFTGYRS